MAVDRPSQSILAAEHMRGHSFAEAVAAVPTDDNDGGWLVSFVDILMLLLTLFVLLLAMSQMHRHRSTQAAAARHTAHSAPHRGSPAKPTAAPAQVRTAAPRPAKPKLPANVTPAVAPAAPTLPASPAPQPVVAKKAPVNLPPTLLAAVTAPAAEHIVGQAPAAAEPSPAGNPAKAAAAPKTPAVPSAAPGTVAQQTPASDKSAPTVPAAPASAKTAFSVPAAIRNQVEVVASANKVNLVVKDDVLFAPGSARLRPTGRTVLTHIADLLSHDSYPVSVQGYTDDTPIHTDRFPSNWELSTARATVVTRFLIGHGIASDRLSAVGYGATRPRASNATAAGRARNRRVSLVVHLHRPAHAGTETFAPAHR